MSLLTCPKEIILLIINELELAENIALSQTCKLLNRLTLKSREKYLAFCEGYKTNFDKQNRECLIVYAILMHNYDDILKNDYDCEILKYLFNKDIITDHNFIDFWFETCFVDNEHKLRLQFINHILDSVYQAGLHLDVKFNIFLKICDLDDEYLVIKLLNIAQYINPEILNSYISWSKNDQIAMIIIMSPFYKFKRESSSFLSENIIHILNMFTKYCVETVDKLISKMSEHDYDHWLDCFSEVSYDYGKKYHLY